MAVFMALLKFRREAAAAAKEATARASSNSSRASDRVLTPKVGTLRGRNRDSTPTLQKRGVRGPRRMSLARPSSNPRLWSACAMASEAFL